MATWCPASLTTSTQHSRTATLSHMSRKALGSSPVSDRLQSACINPTAEINQVTTSRQDAKMIVAKVFLAWLSIMATMPVLVF
jgi:hypothetical protein